MLVSMLVSLLSFSRGWFPCLGKQVGNQLPNWREAARKGLFLQGDQDAQDDHPLGQDDPNMFKMIRLG